MKYCRVLCLGLTMILFNACSSTETGARMPDNFSVSETSLYLSRASINSTDFEQYKLNGSRLYQECGSIRKGRHVPSHQQLFDLSEEAHSRIMADIWQVLALAHEGQAQLADPGDADTMFDPGCLFLTIKGNGNKLKLRTSLDTISDAGSDAERALNDLSRDLRGLTKPGACGNPSFYGLGFNQ